MVEVKSGRGGAVYKGTGVGTVGTGGEGVPSQGALSGLAFFQRRTRSLAAALSEGVVPAGNLCSRLHWGRPQCSSLSDSRTWPQTLLRGPEGATYWRFLPEGSPVGVSLPLDLSLPLVLFPLRSSLVSVGGSVRTWPRGRRSWPPRSSALPGQEPRRARSPWRTSLPGALRAARRCCKCRGR